MLAHVRQNHVVLRQPAEEFVEKANRRLRQPARIELCPLGAARNRTPCAEVRKSVTPQFRLERRNRVRQISDHRQIAGTYAIQLRRINFKVNDLGMRRKSRRIARHAIIEPRPKYHQQIGLV